MSNVYFPPPLSANEVSPIGKRRLQNVSAKSQKKTVILWMVQEVENCGSEHHIGPKVVKQFPTIFRKTGSITGNLEAVANRKKALRWWRMRQDFLDKLSTPANRTMSIVSRRTPGTAVRRLHVKALSGRGRKRCEWVKYVHQILLGEFERLRAASVKMTKALLLDVALHTISQPDSSFTVSHLDFYSHSPILTHIKLPWIQSFMNRHNIVLRKQCGALFRCTAHRLHTEKLISFHLGQLHRGFRDGLLDEDMIENMDETHFIFNMDNKHALGFIGEQRINYADVGSGGEGMTMALRMKGGSSARIEAPFMIFMNKNRNYPIQGTPDDIPGVCYRTGPRAWMGKIVFNQWLNDPKAIARDPAERTRLLYVDNCSGHNETPQQLVSLQSIKTELRKLPSNATHLCHPLDSFIIRNIKDVWRAEWDKKKLERIKNNDWAVGVNGSGKLYNPGKHWYLKLAKKCVEQVNTMKDENNISLVRKVMIRCGLGNDIDCTWRNEQLFSHLKEIVERHPMEFEGLSRSSQFGSSN